MTEQIEVDDFLAHYGVPGMKWGKRSGGGKYEAKAMRKAVRKEIYGNIKKDVKKNKGSLIGGAVVSSLLMGPAGASAIAGGQMAKSAGYSTGKSIAIGLLGGAGGGVLAVELKVRKIAKEEAKK